MSAVLASIKPILRIEDVCELLGIGKTKFYELKDEGWFGGEGPALVEVLPRFAREPRYSGEPFVSWLDSKRQASLLRRELKEAR